MSENDEDGQPVGVDSGSGVSGLTIVVLYNVHLSILPGLYRYAAWRGRNQDLAFDTPLYFLILTSVFSSLTGTIPERAARQ